MTSRDARRVKETDAAAERARLLSELARDEARDTAATILDADR